VRPLPEESLLARYQREGAFTDCYAVDVTAAVTLQSYVAAFYTTFVFKLERLILQWALSKPSTDAQAAQLAAGTVAQFSAWRVEQRTASQLLMSDVKDRTRSWLMVAPLAATPGAAAGTRTRLYFGSAIIPVLDPRTGQPRLTGGFQALQGIHHVYSQVLLHSARTRLGVRC
jgi:hypothetical protein